MTDHSDENMRMTSGKQCPALPGMARALEMPGISARPGSPRMDGVDEEAVSDGETGDAGGGRFCVKRERGLLEAVISTLVCHRRAASPIARCLHSIVRFFFISSAPEQSASSHSY